MTSSGHLTADEAAELLGVSKPTLYAYTSRGQLRSEPTPGRPRERRYYREDVDRLRERKESRRDPARVARQGLHWGSPVLDSGITLIHDGRLYYRGQDAVKLAGTATLEQAAALLWAANPGEEERLFAQPVTRLAGLRKRVRDPISLLQCALPLAALADSAGYDLRPAAVRLTGGRIIRQFTALISADRSPASVHQSLQAAWARRTPEAADVIRTALVLCADHELNISAFAARCAASAGASPYDSIAAALATFKGHKHGGATARVSALFDEAYGRAHSALAGRLRRGERLPGFGHPLYPNGDPRAALLLQLAESSGNRAEWRVANGLRKAGFELLSEHPNVDFALVALARAWGLPAEGPLVLFALGRTAGWIAHILEQYAADKLIRPRARYTGPPPGL